MATAAEITYRTAVSVAEGTRQASKAAAFSTYGFAPANLAAYIIALEDADVAYITAVNTAKNAANIPVGFNGLGGPIPGVWDSLTGGM